MGRAYDIGVKDSLVDPDGTMGDEPRIPFVKRGNQYAYTVYLYLTGAHRYMVEQVTYRLHESYSPNVYTVARTALNPTCKLKLTAYGAFRVQAEVRMSNGTVLAVHHSMGFTQQMKVLSPLRFFDVDDDVKKRMEANNQTEKKRTEEEK